MVPSRSYNCASVNNEAYQSLGKLKYPPSWKAPKQNTKIRLKLTVTHPTVPQSHSADWYWHTTMYRQNTDFVFPHSLSSHSPELWFQKEIKLVLQRVWRYHIHTHETAWSSGTNMLTGIFLRKMETFCITLYTFHCNSSWLIWYLWKLDILEFTSSVGWSKASDGPAKGFVGLTSNLVSPRTAA